MGIDSIDKVIDPVYMSNSAKYMVPNGKYIPIITICIGLFIVVMYLMKMRGHKNIGQESI